MSDIIHLTVAGTPHGRPRPRAMAFKTPTGKVMARVYQPTKPSRKGDKGHAAWAKASAWESALRLALEGKVPPKPWDGPVRLSVEAFYERPRYLLKKKSPEGAIRKNSKPDADNVVKAIMDVLVPTKAQRKEKKTAGFVLLDDCQVHLGRVDRFYAAKGHAAGVFITLEKITEDPCLC